MTARTGWPWRTGSQTPNSGTDGNSAPCNAEFYGPGQPDAAAETAPNSATEPDSATTDSDGMGQVGSRFAALSTPEFWQTVPMQVLRWTGHEFRPPLVWAEPPASLAALRDYAKTAKYTGPTGFSRTAGIWWCRIVAIPVSTVAYYGAWLLQRPGRGAAFLLLYTLLAHTTLGQVLLPWPSWPSWLSWPF